MSEWALPETFSFDGREIRYGITGSGPPVVVVHGTPWSSYNLRHLIDVLAQLFTVHYHDLVGYGQSDQAAGDVSLGIQNVVLDALIAHWGLERPAIVGHDFGGTTVLRTHLVSGRAFDRIVLIDPVALSPWGSPFFRHVATHEAAFAGVPDYIHEAIVRAYIATAAFQPIDDVVMQQTVRPWLGPRGKPAFYRQIAQASERYTNEIEQRYAEISAPVMILWGTEDVWIPVARGHQLQEMIPGAVLHEISDAGHLVIEEQPRRLIDRIVPFLTGSTD